MIRYLIIDDEHIAHDIIKSYCDLLSGMHLAKNCYDALEAFEYLNKHQVELIFLDLNMPVLKGFEFLKTLKSPPKVIVTTAHKEYALDGYEHNIADYLLKPFSFERFLKAINKTFDSSVIQKTVPNERETPAGSLFVESNKKHIQLEIENILYLEASGNYTKIISTTETITIRETFSTMLERLSAGSFLRVHKSFAVAVKQIKHIEGNIIVIKNFKIPVSKSYKFNVIALLK